jgi:uncharacterized protein YkwD
LLGQDNLRRYLPFREICLRVHPQDSVFEVVNGWMRSPEHRENIMDCGLREVGVGLAFAADRTPYWVQDFATPQ